MTIKNIILFPRVWWWIIMSVVWHTLSYGRLVWPRPQWNASQIRRTSQIWPLKSFEVIIGWLVSRQSCLPMSRACFTTLQTRRQNHVTKNIPITDLPNSFVCRAKKSGYENRKNWIKSAQTLCCVGGRVHVALLRYICANISSLRVITKAIQ
jgi:hypothetical protein